MATERSQKEAEQTKKESMKEGKIGELLSCIIITMSCARETMKRKKKINKRDHPADVDAIYQVLKQAGEIRGNSTNSPPTPPTADHPPSGSACSSTRAITSSQTCSSSSTSGKTDAPSILISLFDSLCI